MPFAVVFAPEAMNQLEGLCSDIAAQASTTSAERCSSAVLATCEGLTLFPQRGVPREDIRPDLRITHHKGRTVVAYAVDDDANQALILGSEPDALQSSKESGVARCPPPP